MSNRGGRPNRPYFYFRRNGRVIPAGGRGVGEGGSRGRRGWRSWSGTERPSAPVGDGETTNTNLNSSFLRPAHYAAPEGGVELMSYAVGASTDCPGWQLYFKADTYQPESELALRVQLVKSHYVGNLAHYDLLHIRFTGCFTLQAKVVAADAILAQAWPTLVADLLSHPVRTMATFGLAMHTLLAANSTQAQSSSKDCYNARPETSLKKIYVRPVGFLSASAMALVNNAQLDELLCVRGAAVTVGVVEVAAAWIAYRCSRCRQEQALKQKGKYVSRPYCCRRPGCLAKTGFIEQRSSPHTRIAAVQTIRLLDTELQATANDNIAVELRHDLVDSVAPGQEVLVTGVLKMRALTDTSLTAKARAERYEMYLKAVAIEDSNAAEHHFTERDIAAISAVNNEPDVFKLLSHSIAPELHGQELVKAGVLLALVGGSALHDDGQLNALLVGDPGIGKSHLLQVCAAVSPRGVLRRGRGGGNALAASMKQLTIEANTLASSVLGHCAIDDIDHLATQQGTVIQAMQSKSLLLPLSNAYATIDSRASIIASANSTRGHYDQSRTLKDNMRVRPALLREFHLVFLLLDKPNKEVDHSLTEHLRALHDGCKKSASIAARFAMKVKTNNSVCMSVCSDADNADNYDLADCLRLKFNGIEEEELDLLPPILLRKFIAYARQQVQPQLTAEASQALRCFYMELRQQRADEKQSSICISQLEALIRLTQARARLDFAAAATPLHVRDALAIVRHSLAATAVGDYVDINPATTASAVAGTSRAALSRKFLQLLQARSNALNRRVFDYEELTDMGKRVGIENGLAAIVDAVNLQGLLLKKGPNLYELLAD